MIVITIYTTVNKIIKIIMFYQEIAHSPWARGLKHLAEAGQQNYSQQQIVVYL